MARRHSHFWKIQTRWTRYPAAIESFRVEDAVMIGVTPSHEPGQRPDPSVICLTPHETLAFASWLAEQAEHLIAKETRAAARRAARLQKKAGGT